MPILVCTHVRLPFFRSVKRAEKCFLVKDSSGTGTITSPLKDGDDATDAAAESVRPDGYKRVIGPGEQYILIVWTR